MSEQKNDNSFHFMVGIQLSLAVLTISTVLALRDINDSLIAIQESLQADAMIAERVGGE